MTTAPDRHPDTTSLASPEDQKVTWIELFFDLVFVFSVTQVVGLLHDGIDAVHIGQGLLVFWLVWWAWTQFTWALNAADTTHEFVELATMLATGVAFFMAVALPEAFGQGALWFALPYVLVRTIGLVLYGRVAESDSRQHAAVRGFAAASVFGLLAVIGGAVAGGALQYWLWGAAIGLDVIAALIGARSEYWNLHAEHFAERHGLFVIIALGETVIVAASGVAGIDWTPQHLLVGVLAVATTCALWWTYFTRAKPALDHAVESVSGGAQSMMARDVFSLLHFPMLCGIIAYAAALDVALAHPVAPLPLAARGALAAGILLFVGGVPLAARRAGLRWPRFRALATIGAASLLTLVSLDPVAALGVTLVAVASIAVREQRIARPTRPGEGEGAAGHSAFTDPDDAVSIA